MPETKCTLAHRDCRTIGRCAACGWEENEIQRRKEQFLKNGLTVCEDGICRLIIEQPLPVEKEEA